MDENDGPYKLVAKLRRGGAVESYSIAKETREGIRNQTIYLREIVPDAGEGQNARHICNLLNKEWRMQQRKNELEVIHDEVAGAYRSGLDGDAE
ncbi:hypothetical protein SEA_DIZZYRUDY_77 [Microbacterium phage DizzyRudy]|nr:hypothetical protein SEA_DIZZYRUDY_77 [Microbacterium phage DizzyRudy]WMI34510.1 hypothetical protein SEA_DAMASCUS_73 [Microbacterium phage Damascus]